MNAPRTTPPLAGLSDVVATAKLRDELTALGMLPEAVTFLARVIVADRNAFERVRLLHVHSSLGPLSALLLLRRCGLFPVAARRTR